jgi:hypothetical protein
MGSASSFRSSGIQLLSGLFLLTLYSCFPCADMDCGNGVCSQGVCECYDGYYGSECQYSTGGAGFDCISGNCSYVSGNADYATITDCQNACGSSCDYSVYSGGGSCSDPANFPVSASLCCSPSYPFYCSETGMCYTSCAAADAACSSATVVTGSTSGGGAGYDCISGSCTYVSANGDYATLSACQSACAPSCSYSVFNGGGTCNDPANFPVSTTWCCSSTYPYYCPETGLCYTTCAAADAACSSAGVVTGSGSGGSAGYNCSGGNCSYVSSGAQYTSQAQCESACSSNNCPWELNSSCLTIVPQYDNHCGNQNTFRVFVTNNCSVALKVYFCVRDIDGTWNTTADPNFNQGLAPGATFYHYACNGTGEYKIWTMPVTTFYANDCTWPSCD